MIGNFQTLNHLLHCITQYTFDDVIPISVITSSSLISLPCFLFYSERSSKGRRPFAKPRNPSIERVCI